MVLTDTGDDTDALSMKEHSVYTLNTGSYSVLLQREIVNIIPCMCQHHHRCTAPLQMYRMCNNYHPCCIAISSLLVYVQATCDNDMRTKSLTQDSPLRAALAAMKALCCSSKDSSRTLILFFFFSGENAGSAWSARARAASMACSTAFSPSVHLQVNSCVACVNKARGMTD